MTSDSDNATRAARKREDAGASNSDAAAARDAAADAAAAATDGRRARSVPQDAGTADTDSDKDKSKDKDKDKDAAKSGKSSEEREPSSEAMRAGERDGGKPANGSAALDEDAGVEMEPAPDMSMQPQGTAIERQSCCSEHTSPGCNNPELEACVCDKLESCCTEAWGPACSFIIKQKYCQSGVRECVCGSDEGQWQQSSCCDADWGETCDTVAELKCGALPGCY